MTDEYHAYNALSSQLKHHVINHQEQYVDGDKHTNTIEGFGRFWKRAWYGNTTTIALDTHRLRSRTLLCL